MLRLHKSFVYAVHFLLRARRCRLLLQCLQYARCISVGSDLFCCLPVHSNGWESLAGAEKQQWDLHAATFSVPNDKTCVCTICVRIIFVWARAHNQLQLIYSSIWHENQQYARFMYFSHIYKQNTGCFFFILLFDVRCSCCVYSPRLCSHADLQGVSECKNARMFSFLVFSLLFSLRVVRQCITKSLVIIVIFILCVWILDQIGTKDANAKKKMGTYTQLHRAQR